MLEDAIDLLDREIHSSSRNKKSINVKLIKHGSVYKAFLKYKIEGDYIMTSTALKDDQIVSVEWLDDHIVIRDIDSQEEEITAFLSKDSTAILRSIKKSIKAPFKEKPSFIIGPPGTGKTKVITKILEEAQNNDLKVLVLSPTNMAVENVFERINLDSFEDGHVVLTVSTDNEELQELSQKRIVERKLQPIKDEIDILQEAKEDMQKAKRDLEPETLELKREDDKIEIILSNKKRDLSETISLSKKELSALKAVEMRIEALSGNAFIKSVADMFLASKLEELEKEKVSLVESTHSFKTLIEELEKEIEDLETKRDKSKKIALNAKAKIDEISLGILKINERLLVLNREYEELSENNVFANAKIVGATLVSAALNKKIQNAEFDMVIVDEASMALVPTLIAASQALIKKPKEIKKIKYTDDESLYAAQNDAVRLALQSRMVFVGDPRQLPPIAVTYELKKSIFDYYGVEEIFNGNSVENTVFLDINFRNHPDITSLASRLFYGGMLKSGKKHDGKPSMYIKRSSSEMVMSEGSFINKGNVSVIYTQVKRALQRGRRSIGVITPYRKQAKLVNESFRDLLEEYPDADLQAGTIHTFQGKEKDVIIYDITYSPSDRSKLPATYQGAIKSDTAKLLNVAMTRAQDFLILVGNTDAIVNTLDDGLILKKWTQEILDVYKTYKDE